MARQRVKGDPMLRLSCSRCEHILEIDSAFSGGVCRCGSCGTIQTVPALRTTPGQRPPIPIVAPVDAVATAGRPADMRLMVAVAMAAMVALVCAALALVFLEREHQAANWPA